MPIDETIASYSDLAFKSAIVVYALVFVMLLVQYASAYTRKAEQREPVLVGAGAGTPPAPDVPGRVTLPPSKPMSERVGNMAFAVLFVALGLHILSIVLRGFATHRFPLGNMYEFVTMATGAAVTLGVVLLRNERYRGMWAFLLVPVLILMFLAGTVLYADAAPVVPALKSYWLPIHVTVVSIGSGVFLVAGVASLLFLLRLVQPAGAESDNILGAVARRLPDARTLDRLAYRTTIIGFPIFGTGIILGAIWAESAWGRFWGWDPKETVSFIAWVIYAAYLHARATSGWRETKAAWINIAGFVAMLFNLFIINIVVSGLHSYAGLN
ncbi:c-type cytochrome biogenesis protein CcsB [Nocardia sp. NEAU-G5]|uniref:C-type cytochrome biogenesis protein CcsB n=1 Tax=Nocardia albiluteola TaxID=2842303 RepID=A0ABS6AUW6_9NOCA|nr:c-type cytochrome biogenesis protein CcsB [Nocardia albiluteola]MBU3060824.1 c-type cytochrome biogenesis protein CcsB [Nocardia albiluteola]